MATYEQIAKANETIRTTPIKKKDKTGKETVKEYAEVNQRIKAFRMVYPDGFIVTEMKSNENGVCIFTASVGYRGDEHDFILGTGTAYEKENSTFINQTSYIENCETSAVGRALGMAGFGIDTSVASLEEVQNAIANQTTEKETAPAPAPEKASPEQIARLKELISDIPAMLKYYNVDRIEDLTTTQAAAIIKKKGSKNNG